MRHLLIAGLIVLAVFVPLVAIAPVTIVAETLVVVDRVGRETRPAVSSVALLAVALLRAPPSR